MLLLYLTIVIMFMNINKYSFYLFLDFVSGHNVCDINFTAPKDSNMQSLNSKVLPHKSNLRQSQSYNKFPGQRNSHDPR